MSEFNRKYFDKNIGKEGMESFDNDLKFMGAHEICKMVINDQLVSDMSEMDKYIEALFVQLGPEIVTEVKGNAVTCISKICTKLNSTQIERVVKKLIQQITSTNKEIEDIRDVFVMCIKNIIQVVPHDFYDKLSIIITESYKGIESSRSQKQSKAEQELVEIITLMFRRWGNIYQNSQFKNLTNLLKTNVINKTVDENLRKKSCISIGAVSVMLSADEVSALVKELIAEYKKVGDAQSEQEKLKAIASTLNALSKSVAQKMERQVEDIVELFNSQYEKWGLQDEDVDDFDFIGVICELYESFLSTVENLLKSCNHNCFNTELKKDLICKAVDLITMDPNNNCQIEDKEDEMEEEDEDEDDDDDVLDSDDDQDDQSWRVRRSAMLLLEQIILTDKHLLDTIYHSVIKSNKQDNVNKNLIKRLRERNEGVRSTIIQVLTSFVNQIMVQDHQNNHDGDEDFGFSTEEFQLKRVISKLTQFDMNEVIKDIVKEVETIYGDHKSNQQIKVQAFKLIENLTFTVGKQVLESELSWSNVFQLLSNVLQDSKSDSEIKLSCLISLKRILKYRGPCEISHIQNDLITIFEIINKLINLNQFKIQAECLRLISGIFRIIKKAFGNSVATYTNSINQLLPAIIKTLEQTDVDQEIKHAVISVVSGILVYIGNTIQPAQLNTIFKSLSVKVKNENKNRIIILKLYKRIPLELAAKLDDSCIQFLNTTMDTLCGSLNKEDRSERIATLEALHKIVDLLKGKTDVKIQKQMIDKSLHMIKPKDKKEIDPSLANSALQLYEQIMNISSVHTEQYNKVLEGCLYLASSPIFQSTRYNVLPSVFAKMVQLKIISADQTIDTLQKAVSTETSSATSRSIAALVLVSSSKAKLIENTSKLALSPHSEQTLSQRQCALLTLCEIGKQENLTTNKGIFDGVLNLINNKQEDLDKVRKYASIAFGGISLQNLDTSLVKVIEFINQGQNPYLMLNTLKEIIQNSKQIPEKQLGSIVNFLFQPHESKEQDLKNIVSECIGKLAVYNLSAIKSQLIKGLQSQSEVVRYGSAASYRFFFTNIGKENCQLEELEELAKALINIVKDPSVMVKEAIVKSLNSMAFNLPRTIENEIHAPFFESLTPCFEYFEVVETDLGAFKDKRDKGAPLRTAAFQFLQTILNFKYGHEFEEPIIKVCMGNMAKESEADIKMIRTQILLRLAKLHPVKVIPYCIQIKDAMVAIMKVHVGPKPIPDSAMDQVRICCEVLHIIDINMAEKNPTYNNFLEALKKQNDGKFGRVFEQFVLN